MCDWLSCGDWCDVRLLCGSRSFNAHRAVLASVSSLFRKLLLSCPVDESPIFIFLPEFDDDIVSFVLYYIYNGEVLIPTHRLKMFIDTVNAMEIYIDQQYITQTTNSQEYCYKSNIVDDIFAIENYNFCQLKLPNIYNVRKGMITNQSVRQIKELFDNSSIHHNSIQAIRWNDENVPDLGNLTSVSRYRQRQSFLRDIFIETYTQDCGINGQMPGVLAISNKKYRAPTSVFLSNVYEKNASNKDLETSYGTAPKNRQEPAFFNYLINNHYKETLREKIDISYTVNKKFEAKNFNTEPLLPDASKDLKWNDYTPMEISLPLLSEQDSSHVPSMIKLCHSKAISDLKSFSEVLKSRENDGVFENVYVLKHLKCNNSESSRKTAKVTILNEVLQSPWRPRQPNCYKPLRKIFFNSEHSEENPGNKANFYSKDQNNNRDKKFKTNENRSGEKDLLVKCSICHEVFTRSEDYNVHVRQHSTGNRYSCGECQKTFSQLRNFKYHMSVHRGTKEFAATCSICKKQFNDRGYLSNHMKIHRNRKEYKCASCPKSFNQRVAFNMHVRIHTGEKPYICEECGKAFSRKMLLKQHQRTHSGERPYACAYCDKRFADRSNMTLHIRLHTGVKPFSCTLCPKSFTKKHHLTSHMNFHTGAKPYSCPRCKLAFTQSSNMRTHFKKCNNDLLKQYN